MGIHRPRSNGYVHATLSIASFAKVTIGYNMARNLQTKLPTSDTMKVYDINPEKVERFANDTKALTSGATVEAVSTVRDAAEDSVCCLS